MGQVEYLEALAEIATLKAEIEALKGAEQTITGWYASAIKRIDDLEAEVDRLKLRESLRDLR